MKGVNTVSQLISTKNLAISNALDPKERIMGNITT